MFFSNRNFISKYNLFLEIYFTYVLTIINFDIKVKENMQVNVFLFGITKDLVGKQRLQMNLTEPATVADFKKSLSEKYPELIELNSLAIAVNSEYATDEIVIRSNDEIALIPPVSGG